MSAKTILKSTLAGDATIQGIVSTRVLDSVDVGAEGLKVENMLVGTNPLIQPTIYISWTGDAPTNKDYMRAHRAFVEIWFYQHKGYLLTTSLRERCKALLHDQRLYDGSNSYWFIWAGDVLEMKDQELRDASMERSRYEVKFREV